MTSTAKLLERLRKKSALADRAQLDAESLTSEEALTPNTYPANDIADKLKMALSDDNNQDLINNH